MHRREMRVARRQQRTEEAKYDEWRLDLKKQTDEVLKQSVLPVSSAVRDHVISCCRPLPSCGEDMAIAFVPSLDNPAKVIASTLGIGTGNLSAALDS